MNNKQYLLFIILVTGVVLANASMDIALHDTVLPIVINSLILKPTRTLSRQQLDAFTVGLIDGDGSFLLSKKGYASLEITMDIRDEHALQIIKNVYGGSIKLRSGANALRYRLHHKQGFLKLINDINGHIRNSNRLVQLNRICHKYELNLIYPQKLTFNNGWISG